MTTHPSRTALASYRVGNLGGNDLLLVDEHIAGCAECRASIAIDPSLVARRWMEAIGGAHLSYDAMERRVNGDGNPQESALVRVHVEVCEPCESELTDLETFARPMPRMQPWRWLALAAAAAGVILVMLFTTRDRREPMQPRIAVAPVAPAPQPAPVAVPAPDPLQSLNPELRRVAVALQSGTIVSAELLASLHRAPEHQRGDAEAAPVRVTAPVGIVVESDRPTFRWTRKTSVTVQIFDRNYALVAESSRIVATSWRTRKALPRGATYRWQLVVHDEGGDTTVPAPPAPQALFHIVNAQSFRELTTARESGSKLEAGLICVREGLLEEGTRLLAQYADENPDSDLAAQLAERAQAAAQSAPTASGGAAGS